jgi:hypothetical protein
VAKRRPSTCFALIKGRRWAGLLYVDPVIISQGGKDTDEEATVMVGGYFGRTTPKLVALITPYEEHPVLSLSYSGADPAWRYGTKPSSIMFSPNYSPRRRVFPMR